MISSTLVEKEDKTTRRVKKGKKQMPLVIKSHIHRTVTALGWEKLTGGKRGGSIQGKGIRLINFAVTRLNDRAQREKGGTSKRYTSPTCPRRGHRE